MGRRDARSGWKRQSVLTGKARLVIQFVCEKRYEEKPLGRCVRFPFYQIKDDFEDAHSGLSGTLVSHAIIDS